MKKLSFRITITPCGPVQKFDDKAIDLTKKVRRNKKTSPKRKGPTIR